MSLQKLTDISNQCRSIADEIESGQIHAAVQQMNEGIRIVGRSASRSWIGYQAHVYYRRFEAPPPGDHFSSEWGLNDVYSNPTSDNWLEFSFEAVVAEINRIAENPDLTTLEKRSREVIKIFRAYQSELVSLLTVALEKHRSELLEELRDRAKNLKESFSIEELAQAEMPTGQIATRDSLALSQGLQTPHHVVISCKLASFGSPFFQIGELATVAEAAANYLRAKFAQAEVGLLADGTVFIGHGRSHDWRELSTFIGDRLKLKWDEFNRESTAGLSIKERLESMLGQANFAFLIMTAEDEHADNTFHARENVIHEIGLFQGRLGFNRAIILFEDGCHEFSNVHGIGQIRYPKGYINSTYEEIRRVLEREGLLTSRN